MLDLDVSVGWWWRGGTASTNSGLAAGCRESLRIIPIFHSRAWRGRRIQSSFQDRWEEDLGHLTTAGYLEKKYRTARLRGKTHTHTRHELTGSDRGIRSIAHVNCWKLSARSAAPIKRMQHTSDTSGQEGGAAASDHGPHYHLSQITPAPWGHGTEASQVDTNGADIAEATQGIRGYRLSTFLSSVNILNYTFRQTTSLTIYTCRVLDIQCH